MPDKTVIGKQSTEVWVADEYDAKKIKGLTFKPICDRPDIDHGVRRRCLLFKMVSNSLMREVSEEAERPRGKETKRSRGQETKRLRGYEAKRRRCEQTKGRGGEKVKRRRC